MARSNWVQRLFGRRTPAAARARASARLSVQALEGRDVPATLVVTSLADDGSAGTLRYEVGQAVSGDVVAFDPALSGGTVALLQGQISTNQSIEIDGLGAANLTIDAGGASRAFLFGAGTSEKITGLTIQNGKANLETFGTLQYAYGGAIRTGGSLELDGVTIQNCTAADSGGAIDAFSTSASDHLTLTNCTVQNNSITGPTNAGKQGFGGGIESNESITLTGTSILNNTAVNGGGGIDAYGLNGGTTLTISGSTISGNKTTGSYGGGISSNDNIAISDSTISNNSAQTGGGGIDAFGKVAGTTTLSLTNTVVSGNSTATGYGGGLATTDVLTVTGGAFTDNNGGYGGGGIDYLVSGTSNKVGSSLTIDGVQFTHNTAETGAGVYVNVSSVSQGTFTVTVKNSSFQNNTSYDPRLVSGFGALDVFNTSSGTAAVSTAVTDSTFTGNTARVGGGLVLTAKAAGTSTNTITVSGVTVSGNTATAEGGGISLEATSTSTGATAAVTVQSSANANTTVTGNVVTGTTPVGSGFGGLGGGIAISSSSTVGSSTVTLSDLTVSGNQADPAASGDPSYGGGIYVESDLPATATGGMALNLTGSTIDHNTADIGGGVALYALNAQAGTVTSNLTNDTIAFNTANLGAGGIYAVGGLSTGTAVVNDNFTSLTVAYNSSATDGGGVYVDQATGGAVTAAFRNSLVADNTGSSDVYGAVTSSGHNLIRNATNSSGWGATDLIGVDPMLAGALANNGGPTETIAFSSPSSPAIGAGDPTLSGKPDQRGRIRSASVTIGAYDPNAI